MVLDYYNLREQPFGVTPDCRYLFLSASHREALASLLYGIHTGRGFLAMIAKPGLGKTTLLFHALNHLRGKARTVFLFQTVSNSMDLLRALLTGLGDREPQGSLVQMQLRLKELLLEQARLGRRVVLAIDEAQNLDDSVLELVRMLSNFETSREKLIQIILSGQPELADKIASPGLEQLRQRVSIFACLAPLSREDTELYIDHRIRIAGYNFEAPLFSKEALALIGHYSGGVPRNINNLCFNSLALGCALSKRTIGCEVIREVVADLDLEGWHKKGSFAPRPEERGSQQIPAFLSAAGAPSIFAGWVPKFALALAVLFALGGVLLTSSRWPALKAAVHAQGVVTPPGAPSSVNADQPPRPAVPAETAVQAESVAPPLSTPAPSSPDTEQAPRSMGPVSTIRVPPRRTLFGICTERFGRCNAEVLQEIRRLNPQLSNLDHVEPGQMIRVPVSRSIRNSTEPGEASLAERGTQ